MIDFQSNVAKVNKKTYTRYVSVARIFDWGEGRPNHKSHFMTSSKFFEKRNFLRHKDIVEWRIKSRNLGWHLGFAKEKDLNLKFKRFTKLSELEDMMSKLV